MTADILATLAADWRGWLFAAALPIWSEAGVIAGSGGFEESIGWDGRPTASPLRARVQARQVYEFTTAGALGWDGPWREIVRDGLGFIDRAFRRPDGLYRTKVARDGSVLDDTAVLYDQAFFLFAGAAAGRARPEQADALEATALAHLDRIEAAFTHAHGGFREASDTAPFQSNPHMHLFEASLAWEALSGGARWTAMADRIAELCLSRFIDAQSGALREFFAADWSPAQGEPGRIVEPGHQFEWAWLLMTWAALPYVDPDQRARCEAVARRLREIGERWGVDPVRGIAINEIWDDMTPKDTVAKLWPQTERLKAWCAALNGAKNATEKSAACVRVIAAAEGMAKYLRSDAPGLWHEVCLPDGSFATGPSKASSLYHVACAIDVLNKSKTTHDHH